MQVCCKWSSKMAERQSLVLIHLIRYGPNSLTLVLWTNQVGLIFVPPKEPSSYLLHLIKTYPHCTTQIKFHSSGYSFIGFTCNFLLFGKLIRIGSVSYELVRVAKSRKWSSKLKVHVLIHLEFSVNLSRILLHRLRLFLL